MTDKPPCLFCEIVAGRAPAEVYDRHGDTITFHPLNPVTQGHLLVAPTFHVADFTEAPSVTAAVVARAATIAQRMPWDCNLITSAGPAASQTVFHLHVHLIPRVPDDGLALPWTPRTHELEETPMTTQPKPYPHGDMLEAAMGLISAAGDWKSAGLRWDGDTPIPLPPSDSPDSVEWRAAARVWLDAYAEQLSERLAANPEPVTCSHPADHRCIDCATDAELLASLPPFPGGAR